MKPKIIDRVLAKVIDLVLVMGVAALVPIVIGPLVGFFYSLLADGFSWGSDWKGQSVGKKILKLRVQNVVREDHANFRDSVIRNSPVGFATFFAIIPVWGWIFLAVIGLPLMILEIYLMMRVKSGQRLGDVMADTEVIRLKA